MVCGRLVVRAAPAAAGALMESIRLLIDDAEFDRIVHAGLPEGCDLTVAMKEQADPPPPGEMTVAAKARATQGGKPALVISWTVRMPDGSTALVQAVTTCGAFLMLAAGVRGFVERCEGR